jgi:hypothetical protein
MGKIKYYKVLRKCMDCIIVLEGVSYPDGITKYCRSIGICDTVFYQSDKGAIDICLPVGSGN